MEKLTDPRTPPALSNATPPLDDRKPRRCDECLGRGGSYASMDEAIAAGDRSMAGNYWIACYFCNGDGYVYE